MLSFTERTWREKLCEIFIRGAIKLKKKKHINFHENPEFRDDL